MDTIGVMLDAELFHDLEDYIENHEGEVTDEMVDEVVSKLVRDHINN